MKKYIGENMKIIFALLILAFPLFIFAQPKLVPHNISLKNGKKFALNLPAEFEIIAAAEGLKRVRFFAKAPDGRIFVTDIRDLSDNKKGIIYILDDWDADTGKFAKVTPYLSGLHNPNSVQFYSDSDGQDWIYIAETHQLTRRKFTKGEVKPTDSKPQILATFPDYGLSYKYGGWHLTRTLAFSPDGKLYVSVGSSCDACVEKEESRASIIVMNPDGTDQRQFAKGLRNAVSIKWMQDHLFATNQGVDHLGINKPNETFYAVKDGADYGWPYCYTWNGKVYSDPKFNRTSGCKGVEVPYAFFPARSSALGFDYFDETAPDALKEAFLVSLHGSSNVRTGHGYKVVIMRKGEKLQDMITGFLKAGKVNGRPCDIMKLDENSFLFTDDNGGVVYLVRLKDHKTERAATPEPKASTTPVAANGSPAEPKSKSCFGMAVLFAGALLFRTI